ncbi:Glyoxalase/Bleomycin resistance protein/Dihydroxybiphenyl dioxygenase [Hyaloraphidium curvatum]|nr:Glyoxalase/Bleomycin resistance protein/Dihydroxybiphenyl dioxygenase [Hyaloraphidium curvatum]
MPEPATMSHASDAKAPAGLDPSKVAPSAFCHVVLATRQFEKMKEWYARSFGFRVQFENAKLAFLTYDEEHHRIALFNAPPFFKQRTRFETGMMHFAYSYPTLEALADAYEERKRRGILPFWAIHHGMTVSMYYADPDGNEIEAQVDVLDAAGADAFMAGPEYEVNPIGVDFDPEEFVAAVRAGRPFPRGANRPRDETSVPSGMFGPATAWNNARALLDAWAVPAGAAGAAGYFLWAWGAALAGRAR